MLKLIIIVAMLITSSLLKAQVSETRNLESFTRIEVSSGIELSYKETPDGTSIKVEANEGNPIDIITEIDGETLKITAKEKIKNVKVTVTAKNVESFKASSKSRIVFENKVSAENINIDLESGAYFKGYAKAKKQMKVETGSDTEFNGRIETGLFIGNFKSHSKVNISGSAKNAVLTSSSKAFCNAKNFLTENTRVASDNSRVIVTSKNKIDVNATDNATVTYFGSPKKVTIEDESITTKKHKHPALIAME